MEDLTTIIPNVTATPTMGETAMPTINETATPTDTTTGSTVTATPTVSETATPTITETATATPTDTTTGSTVTATPTVSETATSTVTVTATPTITATVTPTDTTTGTTTITSVTPDGYNIMYQGDIDEVNGLNVYIDYDCENGLHGYAYRKQGTDSILVVDTQYIYERNAIIGVNFIFLQSIGAGGKFSIVSEHGDIVSQLYDVYIRFNGSHIYITDREGSISYNFYGCNNVTIKDAEGLTPTATITVTPTITVTTTPTDTTTGSTVTATPTVSETATPTITETSTPTDTTTGTTVTATPTDTTTGTTVTATPTMTVTATPTDTTTGTTVTATPTVSETATPTDTTTGTTVTATPTMTVTATPTDTTTGTTVTATPTMTVTATPTDTTTGATVTATPTDTTTGATVTATPSETVTPTPSKAVRYRYYIHTNNHHTAYIYATSHDAESAAIIYITHNLAPGEHHYTIEDDRGESYHATYIIKGDNSNRLIKWTGKQPINIKFSNVYSATVAYITTSYINFTGYTCKFGLIDDFNKSTSSDYSYKNIIKGSDNNTKTSKEITIYTGYNLYNSQSYFNNTNVKVPTYTLHNINLNAVFTNPTGDIPISYSFPTIEVRQSQNAIYCNNINQIYDDNDIVKVGPIKIFPDNSFYSYVSCNIVENNKQNFSLIDNYIWDNGYIYLYSYGYYDSNCSIQLMSADRMIPEATMYVEVSLVTPTPSASSPSVPPSSSGPTSLPS